MGSTQPQPRASPADRRAKAMAEITAALDKMDFGRITVTVKNGVPLNVEVTHTKNID